MLERVWSKGNPPTLLVGILIHTATMEDHGKFCKRLKTELLYDPAVPLLSIYLEKTLIWKDPCTLVFIAASFTIAETLHGPSRKEPACQCKRHKGHYTDSVPGSGRSPGGGHGNPLQYSCLENPMDRGAWQATVYKIAKHDGSNLACTQDMEAT